MAAVRVCARLSRRERYEQKENACFPRVKRRRRAPATRRGAAPERRGAGRTRAPPRDVVCRIGGRGAFRFGRAIRWETAGNAPSAGAVRAVARATFAFAGLAAIGVAGTGAAALAHGPTGGAAAPTARLARRAVARADGAVAANRRRVER